MPRDESETFIASALRRAYGHYRSEEWHALPIWARHEAMDQRKRDWVAGLVETPFITANNPEPIMRGSAAIGAAYVLGLNGSRLDRFHTAMLAKQAAE